jgi:hypothetical protein
LGFHGRAGTKPTNAVIRKNESFILIKFREKFFFCQ